MTTLPVHRFVRVTEGSASWFGVVFQNDTVWRFKDTPFTNYIELALQARDAGTSVSEYLTPWLESTILQSRSFGELDIEPGPAPHLITPFDPPEIWGAAFTYDLRAPEPNFNDTFIRERQARRTVIFFKSTAFRAVGPNDMVGSRRDATLMIPEPEVGIIVHSDGSILGYTIVNDVSSRDLPKTDPLYVAYSKTFTRCVSFGPCVVPPEARQDDGHWVVQASVERGGNCIWNDTNTTRRCYRSWDELRDALLQHNVLLPGTLYATGTALSPPQDMHIRGGDHLEVRIDGIGILRNGVIEV